MAFTDVTNGSRIILEGFGLVKLTLAGDCKIGDPLGYSSGWKQADGNGSIYAEFIAGETAENTDVINAYRIAKIGGITTGTAGNPLYLSDTAGGYAASAGTVSQIIGIELGSGEIMAFPENVVTYRAASTLPAVTLGGAVAGGDQVLSSLGTVYIGDTANTGMTLGLTINQGAADDEVLALKSSDVAHGRTSLGETDTFCSIRKVAALGGVEIRALCADNAAYTYPLYFTVSGGQPDTAKSTAGRGMAEFYFEEHDGSNTIADITANGNIFAMRARVSGVTSTVFIVDKDGDLWLNGGLTTGGDLTVSTHDFVSDTTTGTKFGTAVDQKFAFFNKTPIVQQAHISDAATTVGGYATINAILVDLEEFGVVATS